MPETRAAQAPVLRPWLLAEVVEALLLDVLDTAFGDGVHVWRPRADLLNLDALRFQNTVELGREFRVAVADQSNGVHALPGPPIVAAVLRLAGWGWWLHAGYAERGIATLQRDSERIRLTLEEILRELGRQN